MSEDEWKCLEERLAQDSPKFASTSRREVENEIAGGGDWCFGLLCSLPGWQVQELPVTMLGSWPEGLAALRQHGVRLLDLDGSTTHTDVEVVDAGRLPVEAFRQALVLVKSWQTARAASQLESASTVLGSL